MPGQYAAVLRVSCIGRPACCGGRCVLVVITYAVERRCGTALTGMDRYRTCRGPHTAPTRDIVSGKIGVNRSTESSEHLPRSGAFAVGCSCVCRSAVVVHVAQVYK